MSKHKKLDDEMALFVSEDPVDAIVLRSLQSIGTLHDVVSLLPADDAHIEFVQRMTRQLNEIESDLLKRHG